MHGSGFARASEQSSEPPWANVRFGVTSRHEGSNEFRPLSAKSRPRKFGAVASIQRQLAEGNRPREHLKRAATPRRSHAPELEFSYLLTTMADHVIMSAKRSSTSADMSGNPMPAPEGAPVLSPAPVAPPTGYRVSILPALEISARIATADELQNLVKILQANAAIWANVTKNEAA